MTDALLHVLESLQLEDGSITEHLWQDIDNTVSKIYVPLMKVGTERPCEVTDFEKFVPDIEQGLQNLEVVLKTIANQSDNVQIISKARVVNLLLLCGEHINSEDKWTTSKTLQSSEKLIKHLLKLWHCNTVPELLTGAKYEGLFLASLLALRPKLLINTWKTYPAAVSCYKWILFHVKSPHLGSHLSNVLPTALIVLDDFVLDNRIIGIQCIQHIVENVTRTELAWHGHGEVIYKALEPILYHREEKLVRPLISCLLAVLKKTEGGYLPHDTNYEAIYVFICNCWPIVPGHAKDLLKMLLRMLYDVTNGPPSSMDAGIIQQIEKCLTSVVKLAPGQSQILCADIKTKARFNDAFVSVVEKVFVDL
ncbi:hypothetical protein C0J52_04714 [Blattella germanica]|nr:hypothetical protein C0J52_04714 [Blattella germanica]